MALSHNYLKIEIHEQKHNAPVFNLHSLWIMRFRSAAPRGLEGHFHESLGLLFVCYLLCLERKQYFPSPFSASTPPLRDSPYLGKPPILSKVRRRVQSVHWIHFSFLPSSHCFLPAYQLETFFTSNSALSSQHIHPSLFLFPL